MNPKALQEKTKSSTAFQRIYAIVSKIPKGKVMTYKQVSLAAGVKNPRVVGQVLHKNVDPQHIPCHRVVRSDGALAKGYAFGGKEKQKEKLQHEGVIFLTNGRIELKEALIRLFLK